MKPWPKSIEVRVVDARRESALPGVLMLVQVVAPEKNNYSLPLRLTDENGRCEFLAEEIERTVREEQQRYPMDYGSHLEECEELIITIENRAQLATRTERIAKYFPREAGELAELVKVCRNGALEPLIERTAVAPRIQVSVNVP